MGARYGSTRPWEAELDRRPANRCSLRSQRGFTIVEIVIVVVLLGILAVVVLPRLLSPSAFNPLAARDALISAARAAQQGALGRNNVSLVVADSGSQLQFAVLGNGVPVDSWTVDGSGVALGTRLSGNCSAGSTPLGGSVTVSYDGLGNVAAFDGGGSPPGSGIRFCINDDPVMSLCISPAGYAHRGDCRD